MSQMSSLTSARCRPASFLLALALGATPALSSGNPAAVRNAADSAMTRERFCEAAYLYQRLDELSADASTALKAAEALAQGGDRAGAAAVLEAFPVRFPGHPLSSAAARRLELVTTAIGKVGPGAACTAPDPVCGNGLIEQGETCDDGNRVDADGCPATCVVASALPTVTPPVVTPPVVTPPVVTPPVVTSLVATSPVVTSPAVNGTATAPTSNAPTSTAPTSTAPTSSAPPLTSTGEEPSSTGPRLDDGPPPPPPPSSPPTTVTEERDEEVRAPAGPPIAGIALSSLGGIAVAAGGGAFVLGLMPALSYLAGSGAQAAAVERYEAADGVAERRNAAGAAADAWAAQARDATAWNNQGRWVLLGGTGGLAVGAGLLVGGIVLIANHGGEPTEHSDDDDDDDDDDNDDNDDSDDHDTREEH